MSTRAAASLVDCSAARRVKAVVRGKEALNAHVQRVQLAVEGEEEEENGFVFMAGQHVRLFVGEQSASRDVYDVGQVDTELGADFSILNRPWPRSRAGQIEVAMKRSINPVTQFFHEYAEIGSEVSVQGPMGSAAFEPEDKTPVALIAGGVGITAVVSIADQVVHDPKCAGMHAHMVYAVNEAEDMLFLPELDAWAEEGLQVTLAVSNGDRERAWRQLRQMGSGNAVAERVMEQALFGRRLDTEMLDEVVARAQTHAMDVAEDGQAKRGVQARAWDDHTLVRPFVAGPPAMVRFAVDYLGKERCLFEEGVYGAGLL